MILHPVQDPRYCALLESTATFMVIEVYMMGTSSEAGLDTLPEAESRVNSSAQQ